jgi:4-carboxymuconolactone decarboxylase
MRGGILPDYSERFRAGLDFVAEVRGQEVADAMEERLSKRGRRFNEHSVAASYGDVYQREGLDRKWREFATIAILAAMGGTESQITIHTHYGLDMGLTPVEIAELMVQVSVYAGAPRGSVGMASVMKAFEERGIEAP